MKQNATKNRPLHPFEWTPARALALRLVFADGLTDAEIAHAVGVCRRTLAYWKANATFAAALRRMADAYAAELRREAVRRAVERW